MAKKEEITKSVVKVEVELEPTSYKFKPGQVLSVIVASGAHPHITRNPGTGLFSLLFYVDLFIFVGFYSVVL